MLKGIASVFPVYKISLLFTLVMLVLVTSQEDENVIATEDLTCATHLTQIKVTHEGCIPAFVMTTACRGTCRSYAHPKWSPPYNIQMVHNCNCCKPMIRRFRLVTLDCPGLIGSKTLRIYGADTCRCRPCSDHNPEAEKPYDY